LRLCFFRQRGGINDARISIVRENGDDVHLRLSSGIGRIDDAERRFAARDIGQRHTHVFRRNDFVRDRVPHAEGGQGRFRVFAGGYAGGIGKREPALAQRADQIEVRFGGKRDPGIDGAIRTRRLPSRSTREACAINPRESR